MNTLDGLLNRIANISEKIFDRASTEVESVMQDVLMKSEEINFRDEKAFLQKRKNSDSLELDLGYSFPNCVFEHENVSNTKSKFLEKPWNDSKRECVEQVKSILCDVLEEV